MIKDLTHKSAPASAGLPAGGSTRSDPLPLPLRWFAIDLVHHSNRLWKGKGRA